MTLKDKITQLIDSLKATCRDFGLGNDGNEFKIITQVFLYKFLNDKFGYQLKQKSNKIKDSSNWEETYSKMGADERDDLLDRLSVDTAKLMPNQLITYLFNMQNNGDFDLLFDSTMIEIAKLNSDVFSTKTSEETTVPLFEKLTIFVTDESRRANFARALISKLVIFSFEEAFEKNGSENYDLFADIFEYLIKDYNTAGGGKYAEYYTPHSIATIMAKLLVEDNSNMHSIECYDPSAGTGTLLMALAHQVGEDRCTIFSQDISQRSNKLLKLNLILNNLVSSLDNAIQGDTLLSPYHKDRNGKLKKFDFIVSNPPFKMDFSNTREQLDSLYGNQRFWAGVPPIPAKKKESMPIYTLFIQHVVNSLKEGVGKGAIVVPTGFITAKSGVENKILHKLVDDKIVYGVISMPSNVFATTGTNVSVLFLSKEPRSKEDCVTLITASKMGETFKDGKNQKCKLRDFEIEKIINTFHNREAIDDFSVVVSYDQIKEKNYSLSAGQYFNIKIDYIDISKEEFENKMNEYECELESLFKESDSLQKDILSQLKNVKYE